MTMGFRSLAQFQCDACNEQSEDVTVPIDLMQAEPPHKWTRLHVTRRDEDTGLNLMEVRYLCPACLPMLDILFAGKRADA